MEQLDSHWTHIYVILYLRNFPKYVEKIQVSIKSDKNNGYFTWRPIYIFNHILFSYSWKDKCCRQKLYRK